MCCSLACHFQSVHHPVIKYIMNSYVCIQCMILLCHGPHEIIFSCRMRFALQLRLLMGASFVRMHGFGPVVVVELAEFCKMEMFGKRQV